jgi:hypothetical protein
MPCNHSVFFDAVMAIFLKRQNLPICLTMFDNIAAYFFNDFRGFNRTVATHREKSGA